MGYLNRVIYKIRGEVTTEELIRRGLSVGSEFKRLNNVIIDDSHANLIMIGNKVTLAPRVHILAHDASTKHFLGKTRIGIVNIGNNVFIGAGTIVLPGVSIGDNVVIGAGSVVSKTIPSNSVAVGNPARVMCSFEEYLENKRSEMELVPNFDESYTMRHVSFDIGKANEMKRTLSENGGIGYVD